MDSSHSVCDDVESLMLLFKQKTAYEIEDGLVGSEMCIRDSVDDEKIGVAGHSDLLSLGGLPTTDLAMFP